MTEMVSTFLLHLMSSNCCRHFFFFQRLLTHCCTCLIHQLIGNSMVGIMTIALEWCRCEESSRNLIFCWRHFFFFQRLLTHCCTCFLIVHQSIGNSMRITTIALEWCRCDDLSCCNFLLAR